jgi:hypothetical protein
VKPLKIIIPQLIDEDLEIITNTEVIVIDQAGNVANWNRGGNDPTICQVITDNSVSVGHSLAVIDVNGPAG